VPWAATHCRICCRSEDESSLDNAMSQRKPKTNACPVIYWTLHV
jgi:hypothetical protein